MFDFAGSPVGALTVSADPSGRTARVEVAPRGRFGPYVVVIESAPGGGWLVTDPADVEPTWRATSAAAVDEAVALAAAILAERVATALPEVPAAVAAPTILGPADVC